MSEIVVSQATHSNFRARSIIALKEGLVIGHICVINNVLEIGRNTYLHTMIKYSHGEVKARVEGTPKTDKQFVIK